MKRPLVSAIMPTYNQAEYVAAAIESAVMQDYPNLEIVVSDDGSTDGTVEIILEWARRFPDRVIPIVNGPHLGVTGNCNRAIAMCRGELRAFHAGDDLWLAGKIARQVEWFADHPEHVLCGHDVEVFESASGEPLYLWSAQQPLKEGLALAEFVRDGNLFHPLGNMVRADVLPKHGYDPRIPLCSDWKFFVDCLAERPRFGFVDGVHARYRLWSGNVSKRESEMRRDLLMTLDILEQEYPQARDACLYRRSTLLYHYGLTALIRGNGPEARSYLREAIRQNPSWRGYAALGIALLPSASIGAIRSARARLRAERET